MIKELLVPGKMTTKELFVLKKDEVLIIAFPNWYCLNVIGSGEFIFPIIYWKYI